MNIFTLPAVHPHSHNLTVYLLSFTSARVFETKVCYVVKQLQQMSGYLETQKTQLKTLEENKQTIDNYQRCQSRTVMQSVITDLIKMDSLNN